MDSFTFTDFLRVIVLPFVCLLSIIGNSVIVFAVYRRKELKTETFCFLANQCLSDVILVITELLHNVSCKDGMLHSPMTCSILSVFWRAGFNLSALFICIIAFIRFAKLHLDYGFQMEVKITCYLSWIMTLLLSLLSISISPSEFVLDNSKWDCWLDFTALRKLFNISKEEKVFNLFYMLIITLQLVLTTIFYALVVRKLSKLKVIGNTSPKQVAAIRARKFRTVKMLMILMAGYYVQLIPLIMENITRFNDPTLKLSCAVHLAPRLFFVYIMTAFNPLIICYFNDLFAEEAIIVFVKIWKLFTGEKIGRKPFEISNL